MLFRFRKMNDGLVEDIVYYTASKKYNASCCCNLHYSEKINDPVFLDVCEELIIAILQKCTVLSIYDDLNTIGNHFFEKCLNEGYLSRGDYSYISEQIFVKSNGADRRMIHGYLKSMDSMESGDRVPRRFFLCGWNQNKMAEKSLQELRELVELKAYDIFIMYDEPPQSLEFDIKDERMQIDELHELIKRICQQHNREVKCNIL